MTGEPNPAPVPNPYDKNASGDVGAAEPVGSLRRKIVSEAINQWKAQLIDLGGRNNLLYFKELRRGTLDLSGVIDSQYGTQLLSGRKVRLSQLFLAPDARKDAAVRARVIRAKAVENDEERGLQTLHLGFGLSTWASERSSAKANAPVLLYRLTLTPIGVASEDFNLELLPEPEVNPTLIHLLETDFQVKIDGDEIANVAGGADGPTLDSARQALALLNSRCASIAGFAVAPKVVAGNFSYAKLPMVKDLERAEEAIAEHSLLAAIAGDAEAREELRQRHDDAEIQEVVAVPPPGDEFIVLDADSSQSHVIAAVVAGKDLVVIGPPGTGKSQTIANLIATLVARNQTVLFVAEKRAAIEAVVKRLQQADLGDLVLDLHDGGASRRRVAEEIGRALVATQDILAPDLRGLHLQLNRRRSELESYAEELHRHVEPWGISAFEVQARLLEIPDHCRTTIRFRRDALAGLTSEVLANSSHDMQRFIELHGPRVTRHSHPWAPVYTPHRTGNRSTIEGIQNALYDLRHVHLPALSTELARVTAATSQDHPPSLLETMTLSQLVSDVKAVLDVFTEQVFELDLSTVAASLGPASSPAPLRLLASTFRSRYREARGHARANARDERIRDSELKAGIEKALDVQRRWSASASTATRPVGVEDPGRLADACSAATGAVEKFAMATGLDLSLDMSFADMEALLSALESETTVLARYPDLHRLEQNIRESGFGSVLDVVIDNDSSDVDAIRIMEYAWLVSVLDRMNIDLPALASFDSEAQEAAVQDFRTADRTHIETSSRRVKRRWAHGAVEARDTFRVQADQVARQASLKRRHMPIRTLFEQAADVLTAVKPCWVMSPLVVAQALPARPCFDVVIFDEASQIPPADAACSLLRGHRAVVAGDPHQLPPTTFFSSGSGGDEGLEETMDEDEDAHAAALALARDSALTQGQESILDVLAALLPPPRGTRVLSWHYRSRDERLITFSNAQESLYDWSLTTFPGALTGDVIAHVLVPYSPGGPRLPASNSAEVESVVELVRHHAQTRPHETLGVIALGSAHADRITEALRLAAMTDDALAEILDEEQEEALFVKNLERVQGDERDAIILTVGYGRGPDGRVRYNFGPINQQGGQRRLNVAITRARRRMTVVSCFRGSEMDPARTTSEGVRMLRDYLQYAESAGTNLGLRSRDKPALNPFERDVYEHLKARGIPLIPQFGASGFWLDFAAMHPDRPGEPVLAIEADGVMYHSSPTARDRDRLRQDHLERLGWSFHRIWSTDWFRNRDREVDKAVEVFDRALRARDDEPPEDMGVPVDEPADPPEWIPKKGVDAARGPWPGVQRYRNITDYTERQLREVVRWIKSDGRLYTEDEILNVAIRELGFSRRGRRIVDAISAAIAADREV